MSDESINTESNDKISVWDTLKEIVSNAWSDFKDNPRDNTLLLTQLSHLPIRCNILKSR